MIRYTVYLPSHTHDPLPIGAIDYRPPANQAVLQLEGKSAETFYSVAAAMHRVQALYPSAFLEE